MRSNNTPSPQHHLPNRSVRLHWHPQLAKENLPANANLSERSQTKSRLHGISLKQQKTKSPGRSDLEVQYARNQGKIERLSQKLQELYEHFQEQSGRQDDGKRRKEHFQRVQSENSQLEEDIRKVRELLKGSLLEEEKDRLPRHFSELL